MRIAIHLVSMLFVLPLVPSAHAVTFSGQGGGFSGSGTLTTSSNGDGSYTITDITGTGFNGLFARGGYQANDNLLFPGTSSLVDSHGFAFTYTQDDTNYDVDILSTSPGNYAADFTDLDSNMQASLSVTFALTSAPQTTGLFAANTTLADTSFDFSFGSTAAVTPEPSSVVLLGTGSLGLLGAFRKRSGTR